MRAMTIEMPNGSVWAVPVEKIARNRAEYYAHEFDGDVEASLKEDTLPLFESDSYEIEDWASGNMDWSDFDGCQVRVIGPMEQSEDFQEGWINGKKDFIELSEEIK